MELPVESCESEARWRGRDAAAEGVEVFAEVEAYDEEVLCFLP